MIKKVMEIELEIESVFSHGIIAESEIHSRRFSGYNTLALESLFAEAPKLKMRGRETR